MGNLKVASISDKDLMLTPFLLLKRLHLHVSEPWQGREQPRLRLLHSSTHFSAVLMTTQ